MMSIGKWKFGYENFNGNIYKDKMAIYKNDKIVLRLTDADAKEIARLMASWYKIGCRNELADSELFDELRDRGYSGKLKLEREIDI